MKKSRIFSFVSIIFVYLLAIMAGIFTYLALPWDMWLNLFVADVVATLVTFVFSLIFKNASVYDPYWSVQPIVILIAFVVGTQLTVIKMIILLVVCIWGIRLTANWVYTFRNLSETQDWRYTMLQKKTGRFYPIINLIGIHLVPTIVVYACALPAVYVMQGEFLGNIWSYIFIAVSLLAVILQTVSDLQMHKFRNNRNGQLFIRNGLWKYSRHPNYLGEILMWWGVALSSIVTIGYGYYLIIGAVLNTLLFLFVSIPMADARQAQKPGFEEYKKDTRMLLPIRKITRLSKDKLDD